MASFNEFTIDKQEYMAVFKFFDRENEGKISIDQVTDFIHKFDTQMSAMSPVKTKSNKDDGNPHAASAARSKKLSASNKHSSMIGAGLTAGSNLVGTTNKQEADNFPGAVEQKGHPASGGGPIQAHLASAGDKQRDSGQGAGGASTRQSRQLHGLGLANGVNSGSSSNNYNRGGVGGASAATKPFAGAVKGQQYGSAQKRGFVNSFAQGTSAGNNQQNGSNVNSQGGLSSGQQPGGALTTGGAIDSQQQKPQGAHNVHNSKKGDKRHLYNGSSHLSGEDHKINPPGAKHMQQQTNQNAQIGEASGLFPNGKQTLEFEEFIDVISESCADENVAENYLVYAFSMFDRERKGYISAQDLHQVFTLLNESVTEDEIATMIRIAGVKSNDKINFKEFVEFFYKVD